MALARGAVRQRVDELEQHVEHPQRRKLAHLSSNSSSVLEIRKEISLEKKFFRIFIIKNVSSMEDK